MIRKKICMLGAYAVGKTSLVRRFVTDTFSDSYETTIGVKITKKEIEVAGQPITLLLWDLHGDDEFQTVRDSYLRGSSGLFFVVDGGRAETVGKAQQLYQRMQEVIGETPALFLANKSDLEDSWELDIPLDEQLPDVPLFRTSAKTGAGVEEAFQELSRRMLSL